MPIQEKKICTAASASVLTRLIQAIPNTVDKICSYTHPEMQDQAAVTCV